LKLEGAPGNEVLYRVPVLVRPPRRGG
jgi:hypothetical protein